MRAQIENKNMKEREEKRGLSCNIVGVPTANSQQSVPSECVKSSLKHVIDKVARLLSSAF